MTFWLGHYPPSMWRYGQLNHSDTCAWAASSCFWHVQEYDKGSNWNTHTHTHTHTFQTTRWCKNLRLMAHEVDKYFVHVFFQIGSKWPGIIMVGQMNTIVKHCHTFCWWKSQHNHGLVKKCNFWTRLLTQHHCQSLRKSLLMNHQLPNRVSFHSHLVKVYSYSVAVDSGAMLDHFSKLILTKSLIMCKVHVCNYLWMQLIWAVIYEFAKWFFPLCRCVSLQNVQDRSYGHIEVPLKASTYRLNTSENCPTTVSVPEALVGTSNKFCNVLYGGSPALLPS